MVVKQEEKERQRKETGKGMGKGKHCWFFRGEFALRIPSPPAPGFFCLGFQGSFDGVGEKRWKGGKWENSREIEGNVE